MKLTIYPKMSCRFRKRYMKEKIKKVRNMFGISQKSIADFLDIDEKEYIAIENGDKQITDKQLESLCNLVCITVDDFNNNIFESKMIDIEYANLKELDTKTLKGVAEVCKKHLEKLKGEEK